MNELCRLEYIFNGGYPFHFAGLDEEFYPENCIVLAERIPEEIALMFVEYACNKYNIPGLGIYDSKGINPNVVEIKNVFNKWMQETL